MYQTNEERAYKPIDFHNIVLDFTDCKYPADIHRVLKDSFGFPEYYGANWDALWDCLNDLFFSSEEALVKICGISTLDKEMQAYLKPMFELFSDISDDNPNIIFKSIS
ncbi:MAG: hypothetical protein DBX41_02440 [Clostridiales bacterium]|nr:MAG: hypothetical protein DBX41_02440 [Clostridiales bacterium]